MIPLRSMQMAPTLEQLVLQQAIASELEAVCRSPAFFRAGEAVRLLRFLVQNEQAGEASKLREVLIGCELYGRAPSYDPKLDAVVRVNATRLRGRLEEYYVGKPDAPVRIVLPKGSYVPLYVRHEQVMEAPSGAGAAGSSEIAVEPVEGVGSARSVLTRKGLWLGLGLAVLIAGLFGYVRDRRAREGSAVASWVVRPFSKLGGMEEFPAFSPDGRSIVFAWNRSPGGLPGLYIQDLTSDVPRLLAKEMGSGTRPAWSPDGSRLAFVRPSPDGRKHIVVRTMPGGLETEVAEFGGSTLWLCDLPKLSWDARGRQLFTSGTIGAVGLRAAHGDGERCGIVAIDVDRRTVRTVTQPPAGTLGDVEASVSPDGRSLAFLRTVSYGVVDVYLAGLGDAGLGNGSVRRVTFDNREIMGLAWRPEGRALILASRGEDGIVRLTERDLKTGRATLLTDGTAPAAFPAVTRSLQQMAFTSYRGAANIYQVSTAGGTNAGSTKLVVDQSLKSAPQLSPDGRLLTYASDRTGFAEVWVAHADGSNGVRLTHSKGTGAQRPSWFPDGGSILFECRDKQHSQVCVARADGTGEVRRLTHGDSDQVLPSLSRDGRTIYYTSNRTGRWEGYRQAVSGGEPVQLTEGGCVRAVESWDGQAVYIATPKDGPGFLRVPVNHGVIATATATEANRAYLQSALRGLQAAAWNAGPKGVVFCRRVGDRNEIVDVDDRTGEQHLLVAVHDPEEIEALSVAPDGRSIVYANRAMRSGEIDLLTPSQ